MSRDLAIDALGTVIRIDGSALSDAGWSAVREAWHDAIVDPAGEAVAAATVTAYGTVSVPVMLAGLSVDVTHAALHAQAGRLLMLHAAGLATADGSVVALVGPSGRGKTTASKVLGREFGYVSDETVAITLDGSVLPYRKPLSVIETHQIPKVQKSPSQLGLRPIRDVPLRLAALVLLERDDSAGLPRLEQVDLAEGIVALAEQASYLGRLPSPLWRLASLARSVGGIHRLTYRDAASLSPLIGQLGARTPALPLPVVGTGALPKASDTPRRDALRGAYRQTPVLDSLALDQREILLVQDGEVSSRVVVIDGIAPTLWRSASEAIEFDTLVAAAVAAHGQPVGADAATLVRASLAALIEAGLLIRM